MKTWIIAPVALSLIATPCDTLAADARARAAGDTISTRSGLVAGETHAAATVYKGIPYAAPPVGEGRWRSPALPPSWRGVRQASSFGAPCAQAALRGMTAISGISSEDCLYLNVWTPADRRGGKRPVMVWIHGGGFINGSGTSTTYDGERLAARDVVLVTLNYRLGVFGFLSHPALAAESPFRTSGNYGLEDQVAALRWVAANIAAFGGDPGNVTVFGQSAGGASVLDLLDSPLARGLFRRAIVESGASQTGLAPMPREEGEQTGQAFARGRSLDQLRQASTASLIEEATAAHFGPVVDGHLIVDRSPPTGSAGGTRPLLIGSNSREALATPSEAELPSAIRRAFAGQADRASAFYAAQRTADPLFGTAAQQFATDTTFRCGTVRVARRHAASGAPTWQYQFEQVVPGREALGAQHSFEVPYVFGNLSNTGYAAANYQPADRRVSDLMMSYWTNFARTGDPNGAGLPRWPSVTPQRASYARFSSALPNDVQIGSNLRGEVCSLFDE